MSTDSNPNELEIALARPDADRLIAQLDRYRRHLSKGAAEWPDDSDDFEEIIDSYLDDPEKALAYLVLALSEFDDPGFLALLGCGLLEDLLRHPSPLLLGRVVLEAKRSARMRWLVSHPFEVAVSKEAWRQIKRFRSTGPHEEPSHASLPPR